jgi:hypothetical protein
MEKIFLLAVIFKVNSLLIKRTPLLEEAALHYFLSDLSFPLVGNPS